MTNMLRLADRLRKARISRGLTQLQVSAKVGLHREAVTLIESGGRNVSALELAGLARVYRCRVERLLRGLA